ncbi:MAG: peptide chain release factor N(5)-glutamine methyltransferase [Bryobacteraceae bacterium]
MTLQTALHQGTSILEKADIGVPRLTAEVLLSHAMRCDRSYLYAHASDELTELGWIHYGRYLNERLKGKPTQYITHRQEFFGRDFFVDERVLIPRPETEHLVEAALGWLESHPKARILDVGTGSGAIAISVAIESGCEVLASDVSTDALQVAERNRRTHEAPVSFFACDLLTGVQLASVDLLLSNPPYVPGQDAANMQREVRDWEPHVALFAGNTGFEIYRRLIDQASSVIRSGGRLLMELGYQSLEGVRAMLSDSWIDVEVISDLAGLPRVLGASKA